MDQRDEAITLLKEAKAISQSAPGRRLALTRPRLSEWTSEDDRWLATVALYYVAKDHNNDEGGPAIADINRVRQRAQQIFRIEDAEID